jgi:hypothetical protein
MNVSLNLCELGLALTKLWNKKSGDKPAFLTERFVPLTAQLKLGRPSTELATDNQENLSGEEGGLAPAPG